MQKIVLAILGLTQLASGVSLNSYHDVGDDCGCCGCGSNSVDINLNFAVNVSGATAEASEEQAAAAPAAETSEEASAATTTTEETTTTTTTTTETEDAAATTAGAEETPVEEEAAEEVVEEPEEEDDPSSESMIAEQPEVSSVIRDVTHLWNGIDECIEEVIVISRDENGDFVESDPVDTVVTP